MTKIQQRMQKPVSNELYFKITSFKDRRNSCDVMWNSGSTRLGYEKSSNKQVMQSVL